MQTPACRIAFHSCVGESAKLRFFKGLADALNENPELSLIQIEGRPDISLDEAKKARPDVLISTFVEPSSVKFARHLKIPVINIADQIDTAPIPSIWPDNLDAGEKAAEHLFHVGLNHFAYIGYPARINSADRLRGFQKYLNERGKEVIGYNGAPLMVNLWSENCAAIAKFLKGLPKPIGLFCGVDRLARQALDAAHSLGIRVPEDLAVVGTGNNNYDAILSRPSLSSIPLRLAETAREAVRLAIKQFQGEDVPAVTLIPPGPIQVRASSSSYYSEDPPLKDALEFIANRYHQPIGVDDVAAAAGLSRRVLEKRFKAGKGDSIYAFINSTRLLHARRLLLDTGLSVEQIARRCGFREGRHLISHMRAVNGVTPNIFRRQHRT